MIRHPATYTNVLPANAVIADSAHKCRLDGSGVEIIGRRAYSGEDCKREAARRRRAAQAIRIITS